jgi:hypothetical protein
VVFLEDAGFRELVLLFDRESESLVNGRHGGGIPSVPGATSIARFV